MSDEQHRRIPVWMWVAIAVVAVSAAAWLASTARRPDPPESFRYDVAEYEKADPSLIIGSELPPIDPGVPGLNALASTKDGRIFAAGDKKLVILNLAGEAIAQYPLDATPQCLAVSPDEHIVLGMLDRVEILDADGKPKNSWPLLGEQAHITSIAADEENVYVANAGQRVVLRFDYDGALLTRIGEKNPDRDIPGLVVPSPYLDIAFDNTGALWVVNPGRHGFEHYRPNGDLVSSWYRPSMKIDGFCGCCNPTHIAFRSDGTLVTAEKGLFRVKLYSVDQKLLGLVADPKEFHRAPTGPFSPELKTPLLDIAVDADDRILVLDANENAIRVFEIKKEEG
ncbi:MAG: hypothetical protein R6V12_17420 [Candidatus Hydrogenedentota bacterium]